MYNWLTSATKKRIIEELKRILFSHPRYRQDSENVTNKYSFDERPQRGIIIDGTSADRVRLSADNYMGRHYSFCMLSWVDNKPGTSIEWIKENIPLLETFKKDRTFFPSEPGVYFINIDSLPDDGKSLPGTFSIEPNLTVFNELLIIFSHSSDREAQLSRENIYEGSVRLWLDGKVALINGVDFTVDYKTGQIIFLKSTPPGCEIFADYRYKSPKIGPIQYHRNTTNTTAIPGALLAFGDRCQECDRQVVVVTDERTDVAEIYGGKYEVSFDLTVFSRDSDDREKLSDYVVYKVLEIQNKLGFEGIELIDISPGGESEEQYNAEDGTFYYESSISLSVRVDWETYVPLPVVISRVENTSLEKEKEFGHLDGTYPIDLLQIADRIGSLTLPVSIGKNVTYERIK